MTVGHFGGMECATVRDTDEHMEFDRESLRSNLRRFGLKVAGRMYPRLRLLFDRLVFLKAYEAESYLRRSIQGLRNPFRTAARLLDQQAERFTKQGLRPGEGSVRPLSRRESRGRLGIPAGTKAVAIRWNDRHADLAERAVQFLDKRRGVFVLLCDAHEAGDQPVRYDGEGRVRGRLDEKYFKGLDLVITPAEDESIERMLALGIPSVILTGADDGPARRRSLAAHRALAAMAVTHPAFLEDAVSLALTQEVSDMMSRRARKWTWKRPEEFHAG
jgi:hypothetical protein